MNAQGMRDFWIASGFNLLDRDAAGDLIVNDAFIKAYLARPELMPPEDACDAERALHRRLLDSPLAPVATRELAALADADARENWGFLLAFRNRLIAEGTVEATYRSILRAAEGTTPPLFMGQLVHLILRNALDGCDEAHVLRAAELFFRPQRLTQHEGGLLLADLELVDGRRDSAQQSPLVSMFGDASARDVDILGDANAARYFVHSDAYDMALDFAFGRAGRAALATVIERWIGHLLKLEVDVEPLAEIRDEAWTWFVGLDAEATKLGNRLWQDKTLSEAETSRIVALYRLSFGDTTRILPRVGAKPVYLMLAINAERVIRVKPQNLIAGLPLVAPATAS